MGASLSVRPPEPHGLSGLRARLRYLHIRDVGVFGLFVAIFAMALRPVVDNDVFWHLATGRYIWATGRIPQRDPFSWTVPGRAWIAHEWLTETFLYPLFAHGGYPALMLTFAGVIAAAFAVAYATARLLGAPRPIAVLVTGLAALASDHTWGVRPQMLSLLLTALTVWVLTRSALTGRTRALWTLPPLLMLWVNLHGGFIFGLVIIGLFALGRTCEEIVTPHLQPLSLKGRGGRGVRAATLWAVFALSLAVCLVNPNGLAGLVYPFTYLGDNASTRYIAEWVSPDFHQGQYRLFEALLLLLIAGVAFSPRRPRLTEVLLALLFAHLALVSVRNINLFSIVVAPLVAAYLSHAWRGLRRRVWAMGDGRWSTEGATGDKRGKTGSAGFQPAHGRGRGVCQRQSALSQGLTGGDASAPGGHAHRPSPIAHRPVTPAVAALNLALAAVIAGATLVVSAPNLTARHNMSVQAQRFPAGAVSFMRAHRLRGPMLNSYDWGGYLIWTLYPSERVYVDGRPDMYGDRFMDQFVATWQARPGWQATLRRQGVRLVLVEPSSGLGRALAGAPGWRVAFRDKVSVLYARAS